MWEKIRVFFIGSIDIKIDSLYKKLDEIKVDSKKTDSQVALTLMKHQLASITLDDVNGATRSAQDILDIKRQRQLCLNQQEEDRKQHKIDDLKNSITFTLVGLILFAIHFPLARKQSNS